MKFSFPIFFIVLSFVFSTLTYAQTDRPDGVLSVHNTLDDYSLTCVNPPKVTVLKESCGAAPSASGLTTFDTTINQDTIDVNTFVDLSNARLGGYGPDQIDLQNLGSDGVARFFPFSALADRPLTVNPTREAFRSFWRLTNFQTQLNAKAKFIQRFIVQQPPMGDADIAYEATTSTIDTPAASGTGKLVAEYMNKIIAGTSGVSNIRLLSPAFNMTSSFTPPLIAEMKAAGAKFGSLAGCAGNTYTIDGRTAYQWFNNFLSQTGLSSSCRGFVFTEFGDFGTFSSSINARPNLIIDMQSVYDQTAQDSKVRGILYFNALGGNPQFKGHQLSGAEFSTIVNSNTSKAGVNSAVGLSGNFPSEAKSFSSSTKWVLGLATSPGDAPAAADFVKNSNSAGMIPIIRICYGNTCEFSNPDTYINFLKQVATAGPFYAIAGPNEPEAELWLGGNTTNTNNTLSVPTNFKTIKLSNLIAKLPSCLKDFPTNCDDLTQTYQDLPEETRRQYDALLPFSYDPVRGYIATTYQTGPDNKTEYKVLSEGLKFVEGTKEALDESSYGITNSLTPDWFNQKRKDLSTSDSFILPEVEKRTSSIINKIIEKARSVWDKDKTDDDPKNDIQGCFSHPQGLKLVAPLTNTNNFSRYYNGKTNDQFSLNQPLRVPVKVESEANSDKCPVKDLTGKIIRYDTRHVIKADDATDYRLFTTYLRSNTGRSAVVLNNPKMTDISRLLTEPKDGQDLSFTSQMLPSSMIADKKYHDTPLLAQGANYSAIAGNETQVGVQAGGEAVTNGFIARKGGQAHTDLCKLRNYQLMPSGLQRGDQTTCEQNPSQFLDSTTPISDTPYTTGGTCTIPTAGLCAPNNPTNSFSSLFGAAAGSAAQICLRESGGNARAINDGCLQNPTYNKRIHTADYSIGLFQINLLAHPNSAFLNTPEGASLRAATGGRNCYTAFTNYKEIVSGNYSAYCQIGDANLLKICIDWFQNPANNAAYASYMSGKGSSFRAWSTAQGCSIN